MIVITVDPVNNKVGILSVPRDFWVPIPGHGYAKIDLAFKYGYQEGGMDGGVRLGDIGGILAGGDEQRGQAVGGMGSHAR